MELPNFNLKFKKNSFTYSKLWNSLPSQVRLSSDANDFKSKLNDYSFFLERVLLGGGSKGKGAGGAHPP